jgi:3-oxoacyl-[acyl-carrier-protein] synthase-3
MGRFAVLRSTGLHVPTREVSNDELRARFRATAPEVVGKFEKSTGIFTRYHAPEDWATSDLAVAAAKQALERASLQPRDLDLVIVGTDSPDYITPSTSVVVQHKLGATRAGTFDVGCACASFPTALAAAAGMMSISPAIANVLVIGAYLMHKLADPMDPVGFFYGDGAGAAVLQAGEAPGLFGVATRADGAYAKSWLIASGGTAEPATEASVREGRTQVKMVARYPPEINDDGWPALVRKLAEDTGFAVGDIDRVLFTQVRRATIELVMDRLALPMERTHMVMDKWGYTGSACIPMALHDAIEKGIVLPGQLVVLVGSGVGYNQAAVAIRVTDALARP